MRDPRSVTGKGEKRERGTGLGEVGRCELPACEKLRGRSGPGAAERGKRERRQRLRAPPGPGVVGAGAAARFPGPCSHACGWGDEAGARRLHRLPGGKARWNRASSSAPAIGGPRAALAGPGGREEPLVSGRRAAPGFDRGRRGTARPPPPKARHAASGCGRGSAPGPPRPARRRGPSPCPPAARLRREEAGAGAPRGAQAPAAGARAATRGPPPGRPPALPPPASLRSRPPGLTKCWRAPLFPAPLPLPGRGGGRARGAHAGRAVLRSGVALAPAAPGSRRARTTAAPAPVRRRGEGRAAERPQVRGAARCVGGGCGARGSPRAAGTPGPGPPIAGRGLRGSPGRLRSSRGRLKAAALLAGESGARGEVGGSHGEVCGGRVT